MELEQLIHDYVQLGGDVPGAAVYLSKIPIDQVFLTHILRGECECVSVRDSLFQVEEKIASLYRGGQGSDELRKELQSVGWQGPLQQREKVETFLREARCIWREYDSSIERQTQRIVREV